MTELLDVKSKHKVLEIGTGSGYQCAVLSILARRVYTIERIKNLHEGSNNIFEKLKIDNLENFKILIFISLSFYFFGYLYILDITKKIFNKLILVLLYFSTSSLLLIERGNIDHLIFIFCLQNARMGGNRLRTLLKTLS